MAYYLVLFVQLCIVTRCTLEVYEGSEPTSNTSPFFTVQLQQGSTTAFPHVYYSAVNNKYVANSHFYDQTISWIEFGQESTDEITVIICLNSAQKGTFVYSSNNSPYILPYQYNIDPQKSIKSLNSSCISLHLDSSIGNKKHLSLEYNSTKTTSFMDAFYIFIGDLDPPYNKSDPNTIYFGAGAHNIVSTSSAKNSILKTGDNIHTVYISRGSWIYGKVEISGSNSARVNIIGHGVLDGSYFNYANRGNNHVDGASMVDFSNFAKPVTLIGITAHNPSSYTINSLSPHSSADQYRCIAWYYQNDGIGLASYSSLTNSFIRTNDDSTKSWVGGQQITLQNVVISQMYNGAAFQLGWNGVGCVDCVIMDMSVIHAYWYDKWDQNSVINLNYAWNSGQMKTAQWRNVLFENIYIDTPVGRMFSINLDNTVSGASTTVNNITISNFISRTDLAWFNNPNLAVFQMIQIENVNHGANYVHGVHFSNVQIAGKKIVNDNGWNMCYFGDTADIQPVSYS